MGVGPGWMGGPTVILLAALTGLLAAIAFLVGVSAWTTPTPTATVKRAPHPDHTLLIQTVAAGTAATLVVGLLTGWIAFSIAAGAGCGWLVWNRAHKDERAFGDAERMDALATWCEQLRDLVRARQGAVAPIVASRNTAPAAIRPAVIRLATSLQREEPSVAFGRFANELDDADADLVASVLLMSTTHSGRTSDLLAELAVTIRERSAIRIQIDTDRAGDRAEAKAVTTIVLVAVALPPILARDSQFFSAYRTTTGQLVMTIVVGLVAGGLLWLRQMSRVEPPARFLRQGPVR
jgi:tight adherence protein B